MKFDDGSLCITCVSDTLSLYSVYTVCVLIQDMAVEVLGQLEGLHKADLSTTEVHTLEVLRADLNYYVDGYKYRL